MLLLPSVSGSPHHYIKQPSHSAESSPCTYKDPVTSLLCCWFVVAWIIQYLNSTLPSKSWLGTTLRIMAKSTAVTHFPLTLDTGFMLKSQGPKDIYYCKLKKAFAQIHLLGKTIKVICEVTLNLLQLTPDSSWQEFDWQFLFIYILLYNICLNVVNFSDWNFTVSAWIFIDHKGICTTR